MAQSALKNNLNNKNALKIACLDSLFLLIPALLFTLFLVPTGLEKTWVTTLYNPHDKLSWFLREYALAPIIFAHALAFLFLAIPPLRQRFPMLRHVAAVWLLTLIIGGGIIGHIFCKDLVERPRPRDTILLGGELQPSFSLRGPSAPEQGESFTSGHTMGAIMLAVPFFALRRSRPRLAAVFLIGGLGYAGLVGYSRLVIGAHYATDVLWAITFTLLSAAWISAYLPKKDISNWVTIPLFIAFTALIPLSKSFQEEAYIQPQASSITFALSCAHYTFQTAEPNLPFNIKVMLSGYGGPLSTLALQEKKQRLSLNTWRGLYRSISCSEATFFLTPNSEVVIPIEYQGDISIHGNIEMQHHPIGTVVSLPQRP